jgi:orotidine-5'-phosphate decarboxylase
MNRDFLGLLRTRWDEGVFLCVGLDPQAEKIPRHLAGDTLTRMAAFNRAAIEATKEYACAFKPNSAFYEAYGADGVSLLKETILYAREVAPEVPVILDAKRGDIGNTNNGYAAMAFDVLRSDAITVHGYMGEEALAPFLERKEKGVFVLCKTSNAGASEFQDALIDGKPLFVRVAEAVSKRWNKQGNCALVVGATYPEEIRAVRTAAPLLPLLIPGIGAQGGDLERSVSFGKDGDNKGIIIAASRSVLYASSDKDFAERMHSEARSLHSAIAAALVQ